MEGQNCNIITNHMQLQIYPYLWKSILTSIFLQKAWTAEAQLISFCEINTQMPSFFSFEDYVSFDLI